MPDHSTVTYAPRDCLLNRIASAACLGAVVAVPDYVSSRSLRLLTEVVIIIAGGSVILWENSKDDNAANDADALLESIRLHLDESEHEEAGDVDAPARTWLKIGGVMAGAYTLHKIARVGLDLAARILRSRGVHHPYTVCGVGVVTAVYGVQEALRRV